MTRAFVLLTIASSLLTGCSYHLFSPPARMVSLESARTAAPGQTVVGAHAAGYAAIFDPAVGVLSGGVRRGVAPQVEVGADATWAHLDYDGHPDIDRNIYAARVGGKLSNEGGWVALFGGAGAGIAPAAGSFAAADVGAVVSYPWSLVVPFLDLTAFASTPLDARTVEFRNDDGTVGHVDRANTTVGLGLGGGLEIPLDWEKHRRGLVAPRIQLGASLNTLYRTDLPRTMTASDGTTTTGDNTYGAFGLAAGFEWPF